VAEHQPDAILLDLHMPVLDGIGATRRLSAEHPGVAVVILTTYADDESVLDALRAGARSYLTKDADRADIATALRAAFQFLTPGCGPPCSPPRPRPARPLRPHRRRLRWHRARRRCPTA
jgi:DNA-binding NarL/FixJ family response regulator